MKRKRAQLCRQLSGRCTGALAYSLSLIRRMCMLNSAVRLPSSTPSAWKGAQSRTGRTKKMDQSWENLSALFFIGTNWRARTEFMLKSRLYITNRFLLHIWAWLIVTLWWGQNYVCLAGWEPFPPRLPSPKWTLSEPLWVPWVCEAYIYTGAHQKEQLDSTWANSHSH